MGLTPTANSLRPQAAGEFFCALLLLCGPIAEGNDPPDPDREVVPVVVLFNPGLKVLPTGKPVQAIDRAEFKRPQLHTAAHGETQRIDRLVDGFNQVFVEADDPIAIKAATIYINMEAAALISGVTPKRSLA